MGTIADKLELLRRTKERQRAYLEQKYPLLDFDNIPFRAYLDLFQGRSYVPGFVLGVKAYGRSNNEDASTRDILPDYSGNGRDIKLYNFAFEGMSGYGGYPQDMSKFHSNVTSVTTVVITGKTKIALSPTSVEGSSILSVYCSKTSYNNIKTKLRVTSPVALNTAQLRVYDSAGQAAYSQDLIVNGDTEVNSIPEEYMTEEYGNAIHLYFSASANIPQEESISIEELPVYPGALVSDGVDDYGQCIKDFALPDDYTVVAIRKPLSAKAGVMVAKNPIGTTGAFGFEIDSGTNAYSYGAYTNNLTPPALFSYQSRNEYNGQPINAGNNIDTENNKLSLFTDFSGTSPSPANNYTQYALYDLRIYDHSLTAEELQTVNDEMMADYENATGGGIADVTYIADWDAKGRSNDEEETMRSQWIDKVNGKVINLSNYSFSGMSGWGGYAMNWADGWSPDYFNIIQYSLTSSKGVFSDLEEVPANQITLLKNANANIPAGTIIRLSIRGLLDGERLTVTDNTNPDVSYTKTGNGILEFTPENTLVYVRMTVVGLQSKANRTISIEQLPLYPGALVSDGVDDYGKTVDIIDDEIGTVILHSIMLTYPDEPSMNSYFFDTGTADEKDIYAYCTGAKASIMGNPYKTVNGQIKVFARSPIAPTKQLYIASYMNLTGYSNSVISRLIFIKEQLDDAQQEFLKWKVGKEYRDWCKANGYEYAISEMLNN